MAAMKLVGYCIILILCFKLTRNYSSFVFQVNAIQMFYEGLPDQDPTVTQEEVEMGWDATEHVYHVFTNIYGYNGQEFFP